MALHVFRVLRGQEHELKLMLKTLYLLVAKYLIVLTGVVLVVVGANRCSTDIDFSISLSFLSMRAPTLSNR